MITTTTETEQVEVGRKVKYETVSSSTGNMEGSAKIPPDIEWVNLNFKVGPKSILTDCWGKVSLDPFQN